MLYFILANYFIRVRRLMSKAKGNNESPTNDRVLSEITAFKAFIAAQVLQSQTDLDIYDARRNLLLKSSFREDNSILFIALNKILSIISSPKNNLDDPALREEISLNFTNLAKILTIGLRLSERDLSILSKYTTENIDRHNLLPDDLLKAFQIMSQQRIASLNRNEPEERRIYGDLYYEMRSLLDENDSPHLQNNIQICEHLLRAALEKTNAPTNSTCGIS